MCYTCQHLEACAGFVIKEKVNSVKKIYKLKLRKWVISDTSFSIKM